MRSLAAAPLLLALAACAGPIEEGPERRAAASPAITSGGDGGLRVAGAPASALAFVEEVAARCLLDGVVGGAAMIVDRPGRRVVIVGDDEELLTLAVEPGGRSSRVDLSGPAADDRAMRRRVEAALDRAARTGNPDCPALPA